MNNNGLITPIDEFTAEDKNHLEYADKCSIKLVELSSFISTELLKMKTQLREK